MKAEKRKQQIIRASVPLFSERGYYQTHIEDVIKEARVGKGTFYRHFKNKEELFIALLLHFLGEWEKAAFIEPSTITTEDIHAKFKSLIRGSFIFFRDNEALCNIYLRIGPGLSKIFEPYMRRFEEQMLAYINAYLREAVRIGFYREMDVELISNMLAGAFLRLDYYYFVLKKEQGAAIDIDHLTEEFFGLITDGLRRR